MKTSISKKRNSALTWIELLVVLAVLALLAAMLLPGLSRARSRSGIQCVNNLMQIGLASRIWEGDNGNRYPMAVSQTNGGSMEFLTGPNVFRTFQVMSNELGMPKVLICPHETDKTRFRATKFDFFCNSNISYFLGVDAVETNAAMILSGDRNITNGMLIRNGLMLLTTNKSAGWTSEIHDKVGNILLVDGSVQEDSITGLQSQIAGTGVATNRLLMPVLGP